MKDYELSGKKLKMLREYHNMSIEDAAKKALISKESLINIEDNGALNFYDVDILFRFVEIYGVPVSYILDHTLFNPHQYPFDRVDSQVYIVLNMIKKFGILETDKDPKEALTMFYDNLINLLEGADSIPTASGIQVNIDEYEDDEILDHPVTICVKHGGLKGEHYVIEITNGVSLLYNNGIIKSVPLVFFAEQDAKDFMEHSPIFKELNNDVSNVVSNVKPYLKRYDGINYYDHGYAYIKKEENDDDK